MTLRGSGPVCANNEHANWYQCENNPNEHDAAPQLRPAHMCLSRLPAPKG
jgi:hypothetical protein